jgi:excisionase family DNA binding protein
VGKALPGILRYPRHDSSPLRLNLTGSTWEVRPYAPTALNSSMANPLPQAPLLSRQAAAAVLNVSLRTTDELIASGDLPVVRIGRAVRIRQSAIDYLIEARESRGPRTKKRAR